MSEAAVLSAPIEEQSVGWVELDEYIGEAPMVVDLSAQDGFIELDAASVPFDSQDAMRFGARAYTADQAEVIQLATRVRKPLRIAALPLDDE